MNIYQNKRKNKYEAVPINIVTDFPVKNWYSQEEILPALNEQRSDPVRNKITSAHTQTT
jgi:hypothetical protein